MQGYQVLYVSPDDSYTTVQCRRPTDSSLYKVAEVIPVRLEWLGGGAVKRGWANMRLNAAIKEGKVRVVKEGKVRVVVGQSHAACVSVTPVATGPLLPLRFPANLPRWSGGWPGGAAGPAAHLTPHWLGVAFGHLRAAETARGELASATQQEDILQVNAAVAEEFSASMQATRAGVLALDAFCAAVQEHVSIPRDLYARQEKKRTGKKRTRNTQVFEILRRGFTIDDAALPALREWLKDIYRLRDLAVPASPKYTEFRCEVAKAVVSFCLGFVAQLVLLPKENKGLMRHCAEVRPTIQRVVEQWEAVYGSLYPEDPQVSVGETRNL